MDTRHLDHAITSSNATTPTIILILQACHRAGITFLSIAHRPALKRFHSSVIHFDGTKTGVGRGWTQEFLDHSLSNSISTELAALGSTSSHVATNPSSPSGAATSASPFASPSVVASVAAAAAAAATSNGNGNHVAAPAMHTATANGNGNTGAGQATTSNGNHAAEPSGAGSVSTAGTESVVAQEESGGLVQVVNGGSSAAPAEHFNGLFWNTQVPSEAATASDGHVKGS